MDYAELHCISNYSFLRGASHPEELVEQAARLGYRALALTDECSLAGIVKAHVAAREHGLHLIVGAEFRLEEGIPLVLLAPDRRAYAELSGLITLARRRAPKGEYELRLADLEITVRHCLAIWPAEELAPEALQVQAGALRALFAERLWIGVRRLLGPDDQAMYLRLHAVASALEIPMVACGSVRMHARERQSLADVLCAIRLGEPVQTLGTRLAANAECHLRPLATLARLYPRALLDESTHIAARCHFSLDELRYEYPEEVVPAGRTPESWLRELVFDGMATRWPEGAPPHVLALIEKELALIHELRYEYYFLTVHDIVHYARRNGILCQGRGSAANSVVCFCLAVTEVDPARIEVLFERFISKERNEPPDIDVDFEHQRREEVIQYIYRKYGRDRAALAATVICYRPRSAVRDVGKALGLDQLFVDKLAKSLSWWDQVHDLERRFAAERLAGASTLAGHFLRLVNEIVGFPRHLSQHVGGFVITRSPLSALVPVENASMPERTVIQWDKDDIDAVGLLKVDVLALGMLSAIRRSFGLIRGAHGTELSLSSIPAEDKATWAMLGRADSIGVFQVESRAQMAMLPRLRPRVFYDLVIEVAIVRPGPIQGDMVHPYLKRRQGLEPVEYPNEAVRAVLERTLGVPIFQEQVIKLAMVAAGFSGGEADRLRRAMAAWKRNGSLLEFHDKVVDGMLERGHTRDFAERLFNQMKGFGDYGFPESHAASFALLAYASAWLKCHYPAAFCCALLNSQPMGFYSPSQLIQDARRHGVEVLPVDVVCSDWESELEGHETGACLPSESESPLASVRSPGSASMPRAPRTQSFASQKACGSPPVFASVRLGLQQIKGMAQETAQRIVRARGEAPFTDLADLAARAGLDRGELERLASAGALATLGGHRHQAHWRARAVEPVRPLLVAGSGTGPPLSENESSRASMRSPGSASMPRAPRTQSFALRTACGSPPVSPLDDDITLAAPAEGADITEDYRVLGLTLGRHPLALLRECGRLARCRTARELEALPCGRFVRVAGLVTCRQRPGTASGVLFLTLEDETGNINVVVWRDCQERHRRALIGARLLLVKGTVETRESVTHVIAGRLEDHTALLGSLLTRSRDFH